MDVLQTVKYGIIFILCGAAGIHASYIHAKESQLISSTRKLAYFIYMILFGIYSAIGFLLFCAALGLPEAEVKAPGYDLLGFALLLAYIILTFGRLKRIPRN